MAVMIRPHGILDTIALLLRCLVRRIESVRASDGTRARYEAMSRL